MSGPYTGRGSASPYVGSVTPPPGAGQRTEDARGGGEHMPGGLLRPGTRVKVRILTHNRIIEYIGKVADHASVPAPYVSIGDTDRTVIFLGPGVTIEHAPEHPALD